MRHTKCGKDITLRGTKYSQGKANSLPSRVGKASHLASFLAAGPAALHLVFSLISFTSLPDHTVTESSQLYPTLGIKVHLILLLLQSPPPTAFSCSLCSSVQPLCGSTGVLCLPPLGCEYRRLTIRCWSHVCRVGCPVFGHSRIFSQDFPHHQGEEEVNKTMTRHEY